MVDTLVSYEHVPSVYQIRASFINRLTEFQQLMTTEDKSMSTFAKYVFDYVDKKMPGEVKLHGSSKQDVGASIKAKQTKPRQMKQT